MEYFLQWFITGIAVGGLYALLAVSVVIIFKATGVFNFAIGQFMIVGAYVCWWGMEILHLPFVVALLLTFAVAFILGIAVERFALRPLTGQPHLSQMLMTLGLAFFLQGLVLALWGAMWYKFPSFMPAEPLHLPFVTISQQYVFLFIAAGIVFIGLHLFFNRTRSGLDMRAVAEDQQISRVLGINTRQAISTSWIISGILAAIGGILFAAINGLNISLSNVAFICFPAVILAGLTSVPGCLVGGIIVGVLEYLAGGYIDPLVGGGAMDLTPFIVLLILLLIKPDGIFGLKRIERI